ncbi:hypothetical protein K469DRAFT_769809 [Zopfia rhizophila CBS 207.26]|uniref:Uracil-DNA glycosylase-like domain-containing protein n=1 Tax=Zopfia rhizophila CBS 207.26 TaxID=1314779 RepID=A0A6A6E7N0_9PEZI|nr:hypothetical protein K469DRAFT_769809 [Zopfia rhizophila CBS 207.26]
MKISRPLNDHPWCEGTKRVVKECHTLDALDEALRAVLNSSLVDGASVLDVEAFYNSNFEPTTVFQAISAKCPNVILCMGKEAEAFFYPCNDQLRSDSRSPIQCFYSIHPSRSLHYQDKNCPEIRHKLFDDIRRTCKALKDKKPDMSATSRIENTKRRTYFFIPITNDKAAKAKDIQTIRKFLHTLAELCLWRWRMPLLGVGIKPEARKSYFTFSRWHIRLLRHILLCGDTVMDPRIEIRAAIIPIFVSLNLALKRISYFPEDLPFAYEIAWRKVIKAMADAPINLEEICCQLASLGGAEKVSTLLSTALSDELRLAGLTDERTSLLCRMERISRRVREILSQQSENHQRRNSTWLGPLADKEECSCLTDLALKKRHRRHGYQYEGASKAVPHTNVPAICEKEPAIELDVQDTLSWVWPDYENAETVTAPLPNLGAPSVNGSRHQNFEDGPTAAKSPPYIPEWDGLFLPPFRLWESERNLIGPKGDRQEPTIWPGNEPSAREHLKQLDNGLSQLAGDRSLRDIVDTVPLLGDGNAELNGNGVLKVVLGSVNRRLDRNSAELDHWVFHKGNFHKGN